MIIELIKGEFIATDALDLITRMIQVKIKFHEDKINNEHNEEDIKMRENKIKQLQKDLYDARNSIEKCQDKINITGQINFVN